MSAAHSRIAPTPSGFLHRGNAYNFLLTQYITARNEGSMRLRIDDLDAPRVRDAYTEDIFQTLHWLGVSCDDGPKNVQEQNEKFSQQLRLELYSDVMNRLVAMGHVFACNCSRKDVLAQSVDGQYPGTCISKNIPLDAKDVTWRIKTPVNTIIHFQDELVGPQEINIFQTNRHFVVRRRDGIPAYHIASLTDDRDYGINLIVRGTDLLNSTAAQLHLATLLGYEHFRSARFYHHPLLQAETGEKLSKSAGSTSIRHLRDNGITAAHFLNDFATWLNSFRPSKL